MTVQVVRARHDRAQSTWVFDGNTPGPAGAASWTVDGVSWWADWAEPPRLVRCEVSSAVLGGDGPQADRVLALVELLLGRAARRLLEVGPESGAEELRIGAGATARQAAGWLAVTLDELASGPCQPSLLAADAFVLARRVAIDDLLDEVDVRVVADIVGRLDRRFLEALATESPLAFDLLRAYGALLRSEGLPVDERIAPAGIAVEVPDLDDWARLVGPVAGSTSFSFARSATMSWCHGLPLGAVVDAEVELRRGRREAAVDVIVGDRPVEVLYAQALRQEGESFTVVGTERLGAGTVPGVVSASLSWLASGADTVRIVADGNQPPPERLAVAAEARHWAREAARLARRDSATRRGMTDATAGSLWNRAASYWHDAGNDDLRDQAEAHAVAAVDPSPFLRDRPGARRVLDTLSTEAVAATATSVPGDDPPVVALAETARLLGFTDLSAKLGLASASALLAADRPNRALLLVSEARRDFTCLADTDGGRRAEAVAGEADAAANRHHPTTAPSRDDDPADIDVYLGTDDEDQIAEVLDAVRHLERALGLERASDVSATRGSIWARWKVWLTRTSQQPDVQSGMAKAQHAVNRYVLDKVRADVDDVVSVTSARLIDALAAVPSACVVLHALVVVQFEQDGQRVCLCRQLTDDEQRALKRFPEIQTNPAGFFDGLALAVDELATLEELEATTPAGSPGFPFRTVRGYDLFLCYAWEDKLSAEGLRIALEKEGLRVFQDQSMQDYDHIEDHIGEALTSSRALLALYTHDFLASPYCRQELHFALLSSHRLDPRTARALAVLDNLHFDDVRPARLKNWRLPAPSPGPRLELTVQGIAAHVRRLVATGDLRLGDAPNPRAPDWFPRPLPGPAHPGGRELELWAVHDALFPDVESSVGGQVVAVVGPSGVGKTTLAAHYARTFANDFPGGVFVLSGFDRPGAVVGELRDRQIAAIAGSPGQVHGHLATRLPYLWIVDGASATTDRAGFDELLAPTANGRSLVTVRRDLGDLVPGLAQVHLRRLPGHDDGDEPPPG